MELQDILEQLSERGRLEWELAVLKVENTALKANQPSEPDDGTTQA